MTNENHTCSITRDEFLDSFVELYHAIKDYESLLVMFSEEARPNPQEVMKILEEQVNHFNFDGVNSKAMGMIGAYIRFTLSNFKGPKLTFSIPDSPSDEFFTDDPSMVGMSDHIEQVERGLMEIQEKVYYLTKVLPPKNTEKIRLLLKTISSFFKSIVRKDFQDMDNHVAHIHHLTANKESFFLVNEIGRTVREIHNNLQDFSDNVPVDGIDSTVVDEMPDAIDKLNLVIQRMEEAANTTLDQTEALLDRNAVKQGDNSNILASLAEVQTKLDKIKADNPGSAAEIDDVKSILSDSLEKSISLRAENLKEEEAVYFEIIGSQSFQDLTGQTLKKIINFIEQLELSLLNILQKYSSHLPPKAKTEPASSPLQGKEQDGLVLEGPRDNADSDSKAKSQGDINDMLAGFGF